MKYEINKQLKSSVFLLLISSAVYAHAFSLNDFFNGNTSDETVKEKVVQPVVKQQVENYKMGRRVQYNQWILQCLKGNTTGKEKCNLIHQINNNKNQQIIKIEVLKSAEKDFLMFYVPLGTYLPAGASLLVGEGEYKMPITTCMNTGCQAKLKVDWNLNQKLKREDKASVQLLHTNQKQKTIGYSFVAN